MHLNLNTIVLVHVRINFQPCAIPQTLSHLSLHCHYINKMAPQGLLLHYGTNYRRYFLQVNDLFIIYYCY